MSKSYQVLLKIVFKMYLKEIQISLIVSEMKKVSLEEGWGGKHIMFFPPYSFFKMFVSGNEENAKRLMKQWYFNRFVTHKLSVVPKSEGGMRGGSLSRVIANFHVNERIDLKEDLSNAETELIWKGIDLIVEERFRVLKSIYKDGYIESDNFIRLKQTDRFYTIIDGHHRVAAMAACSYSKIQGTTKNNVILRLLKKVSKSSQLSKKIS